VKGVKGKLVLDKFAGRGKLWFYYRFQSIFPFHTEPFRGKVTGVNPLQHGDQLQKVKNLKKKGGGVPGFSFPGGVMVSFLTKLFRKEEDNEL
jgi:hypothetical protein